MLMAADIHVGDVGTSLVVAVVDEAGDPVDVSAATERTIYLTRPDGTILTRTAVNDTTGVDGLIRYDTVANATLPVDFSQSGNWTIEGFVDLGAAEWSTAATTFVVAPAARWPGL